MDKGAREVGAILEELGRLVVVWNGTEGVLRKVVNHLSKDVFYTRILTAHMGTTAMCDALRTWANDHATPEEQDRLLYTIKCFEFLREYRNHYVHGLGGSFRGSNDDDTPAFGIAMKITARTKYTVARHPVTAKELRKTSDMIHAFNKFLSDLFHYFLSGAQVGQNIGGHMVQQQPLPEILPLPKRLPSTLLNP